MHLSEMEAQSTSSTPNWHAIYTRHQHEKSVASSLTNKGHETFLPLYHSVRRWQDRAKDLWLPLFPGYVFIREGMDQQFQIVTTPGVIYVVGWAGRPAVVPQYQLNVIRKIIENCISVEAHPYLGRGDRVRIKSGPLMGLEGILTRTKAVARLVVSIEMLGQSAAVEIDALNVERVGPLAIPMFTKRLRVPA
jgi:transcription antitermination factor NusG